MGSKAVEKFRSRHPSHHLLLSSLSMRLAVDRKVGKKKTLACLKSVNSRTAAEEDMMENGCQKGRLKRLMSEHTGEKVKRKRGQKTVRWSQQLIKVNTHQRLLKWNETHKLFAGPPAEPLTSHRRGASGNLSHFKLQP